MSAIAQGKENAANIKVGDRILVKHYNQENEADRATLEWLGKDRALGISRTKTGEGVTVARVLEVQAVMVQGRRAQRRYNIITTEGVLENNAPIQTMIMAPEDAAGIKRAHVEALAQEAARQVETEMAEAAMAADLEYASLISTTLDEGQRAEVAAGNPVVITDSAQAARVVAAIPFFRAKAEVDALLAEANRQLLGRTLRPILEEGVRMARDIPEGRRRHGQTKARRDALRHAAKLELAGI